VSTMNPAGIQAQDEERRSWAENGCDFAFFLVQFLRGQRRLPIQALEIVETQLYKRSSEAERKAIYRAREHPHAQRSRRMANAFRE
jgi:hypothetical protein